MKAKPNWHGRSKVEAIQFQEKPRLQKKPLLFRSTLCCDFLLFPNITFPISNVRSQPLLLQERHEFIDTEVGKDLTMPIHGGCF